MPSRDARYRPEHLIEFAEALFRSAGLGHDKARSVAGHLVEADLLGHTTHGLQLAAPYLRELDAGAMRAEGEPEVVGGRGGAVLWDGRRLPGVWLTARAVATACGAAREHGIGAVSIRNSHHIGCLAVFLEAPARDGLMVLLTCSDPATASVAPFGGLDPVMTPNPFAVGIPTTWPRSPDPHWRGRRITPARPATPPACCSRIRRAPCCPQGVPITATRATDWASASRR